MSETFEDRVVALETAMQGLLPYGINWQAASTYTLQPSDNNKTLYFTSALAVALTVPTGLGGGFQCGIIQGGVGQVTPTVAGTAIHNRQGFTKTAGQWGYISLIAVQPDFFVMVGDAA
jgi:hypothetical protein